MQHVHDVGHLVVGVDQNTYLFGYLNPTSGLIEGFDVDILQEVAKAIFGNPLPANAIQYTAITSAQRIPYVQQSKVDIVARTMTITCDRWKQVDFSTEYYHAGQRVLVPTNSTAAAFTGVVKAELLPVTLRARLLVNAVPGSSCAKEPPPNQNPWYFQLLTTSR